MPGCRTQPQEREGPLSLALPAGTEEWTAGNTDSALGIGWNFQRGSVSFDPDSCPVCHIPLDPPF